MNSSISSQWIMLDVILHLAFITYVNLGEKVDENIGYFLMQGLIIVPSWVGTTQILWIWFGLFFDFNLIDYGLEALLFEKENNMFTLMISFEISILIVV
jgi:hypothetical protein